jgi:hypothetical protein
MVNVATIMTIFDRQIELKTENNEEQRRQTQAFGKKVGSVLS